LKQWGQSQAVDSRLLGLLGPYHQHTISTFNTCSRGPTHQSLTNTGGGYSLEGVGFPYTTPRPSQSTVLPFSSRGPARSPYYPKTKHLIQDLSLTRPMATTWSSDHLVIHRNLHLCLAIANDVSLVIESTRVVWMVTLMQLGHQFNSYNLMHNQES
jgi:hypothetical protein